MSTAQPDDFALEALRRHYADRWRIRRTENLWIATARDPEADHAPTVVNSDVEAFVAELESPPARAGRPFSLLAASMNIMHGDELSPGVWFFRDTPPV